MVAVFTLLLVLTISFVVVRIATVGLTMTGISRDLAKLQLASEGVLVLGVERADGRYVGAPRGKTRVEVGDGLILYGRRSTLMDLDSRQTGLEGNLHHVISVTEQFDRLEVEEESEDESNDADTTQDST